MKVKLVTLIATITFVSITSEAGAKCGIKELSKKNYIKCLELSESSPGAVAFCQCVEKNMDWNYMLKNKVYIDLEKCEFTELKKLLTEKQVTDKCASKKIPN